MTLTAAPPGRDSTISRPRPSRLRLAASGFLIALAGIATVSAVFSWWANEAIRDPEIMVAAFGDLPQNPERADQMGEWITGQVVEGLAVEDRLAEALPFGASLFSGRIVDGVERVAATASSEVIQTELFGDIWLAALPVAHESMIGLLDGTDGDVLSSEDGVVALDMSAAIFAVYENVTDVLPDIAENGIIARVTGLEPGEAKDAVGDFLARSVPEDLGSIVLIDSAELAAAQRWVAQLGRLVWLSALAALAAAVAAIVIADHRYRTSVVAGVTIAIGLVTGALLVMGAERVVVNALADLPMSDGGTVFGSMLGGWQVFMVAILVVALGSAVAGAITRMRRLDAKQDMEPLVH